MEYYIILGVCFLVILVLKIAFSIKIKDIKLIKKIGYDKELNEIVNKLPENEQVCKDILNNKNVKIQINDEKTSRLSYYEVITNKIIIANIKDTFTRIQTIAHECAHSKQNRNILLFNFFFSNLYLLYFIIVCILTILRIIKTPIIFLVILILMSFIYYAIRSYLETDAMSKAPYISKEYMKNRNEISEEELKIIIENYEKMNSIGIPMTNFGIAFSIMTKIIIYIFIFVIL